MGDLRTAKICKVPCLVDPTPFPGHIGHHFQGNPPAVILGHHETRCDRGVLDRLQQPVEFFYIHGILLSSQLTIRLSLVDVVHDIPSVSAVRDEFRASSEQRGERLLCTLVDEGDACKGHRLLERFSSASFIRRHRQGCNHLPGLLVIPFGQFRRNRRQITK